MNCARKQTTSIQYQHTQKVMVQQKNRKKEKRQQKELLKDHLNPILQFQLFLRKYVFLLHYPKGREMNYSAGIISNISEDNFTIQHKCDSSSGSSGGPLINSENFFKL